MADKVKFRVGKKDKDDVFALFPDIPGSPGFCACFQHVGQHGSADYKGCMKDSRPATPAEYKDLAAELRGRGYRLKIA